MPLMRYNFANRSWESSINDGASWQHTNKERAIVYEGGSGQSIPSGVFTVINYDTVLYDEFSMWSGGQPSRLTCPRDGLVQVGMTIWWQAHTAVRMIHDIIKNGGGFAPAPRDSRYSDVAGNARATLTSLPVEVNASDYFESRAFQGSGSNMNYGDGVNVTFGLWYIE